MEILKYLPLLALFILVTCAAKKPDKPSVDLSTDVTDTDGEVIITQIRKKLRIFGSDKLAKNVDEELTGISGKWSNLSNNQKRKLQNTLGVVSTNIELFSKTKDNPVGAIKGALEIIGSLGSEFELKGQLAGVGHRFVSSLLGLFGKGSQPVPFSNVVDQKVIKKYGDQTLQSEAAIALNSLTKIKGYLYEYSREGIKINTTSRAPIEAAVNFTRKLFADARDFEMNIIANKHKCLTYMELYAYITALEDIIISQSIPLLDSSAETDIKVFTAFRSYIRSSAKHLFKTLYITDKTSYGNTILMYFDPDDSPVTDAYATAILGLGKFDRSLADGLYCIVFVNGQDLVWDTTISELKMNNGRDPYTTLKNHSNENCYWKLVPHGDNVYSIKTSSNAQLTLNGDSVSVERYDPALWQFTEGHWISILSKVGCDEDRWSCNAELHMRKHKTSIDRISVKVGKIEEKSKGVHFWKLKKRA